ncbi:flippase activity-associated protein Agl23 [uncultured Methanospirillum sp.]|uniref:flippase activity-associated protein Agl23 n=1 Tax=uncultured Methanospirillum sp. TaxID=262503 RepID=UPI0029C984F2|nr:flippase activity-associated protein Agl23 [uncultured Methanospirillum sp.]
MCACSLKDRLSLSPFRIFILIFLLGLMVRIILPEVKLLHHDEAIHAWFTYDLITKGTYLYDPMYHGPLLYYLTGAAFLLFKDSDMIVRFLPGLFGAAIIPLFWILYREGWVKCNHALVGALFFAISPCMVYFSRFLRHDIFQLFFTVALLVFLLMYFDKGRWQDAAGAAVCAACGLSLKEDMPFTLLIFGSFFLFMILNGRIALPLTWRRDLGAGLLIMVAIGATCYTTFFTHPEMFIQAPFKAIEHWMGIHGQCRLCGGPYWYLLILGLYEVPIALLAGVAVWQYGIREKGFAEVRIGIASYLKQLIGGGGFFKPYVGIGDRSRFFFLLALYWTVLSMIFYGYVGEKVPWLIIHQLFPMILLAAYDVQSRVKFIAVGIACVFLCVMMVHVCYTPADINEPMVQVQNSEDMREVMKLIDNSNSVVVATESYWPLPWYYRGDKWDKISFYGHKVEPSVFESKHPDLVITHDTESYPDLPGYEKKQYKLSYWFSWYDNKDRVPMYYLFRDGKTGSINLDVFVKEKSGSSIVQ